MKTDKFAMEVGQTVDYVAHHRRQLLIYGSIAVAVAAIGFGVYWYLGHQQTVRAQALAYAILIQESPVGPASPTAPMAFATDDAKRAAATKQFSEVAGKYPGTNEGAVAKYYLGAIAADQGKMADAEKFFKEAADAGDRNYSSLARFSLSDVYFGEKKNAEAEKILRDMMDHPTALISKEQATIALARGIARTKPAEARKLLEPLRTQAGPVSQAAINAVSEIPGQ
jgi:predicted negative regulator of RcsB-dependent stress response